MHSYSAKYVRVSSLFNNSDFNPIPALNIAEKNSSNMITL